MTDMPAKKCLSCSLYYDTANFCACLSSDQLYGLSKNSCRTTLKRGQSFGTDKLKNWPIIAIVSGVFSIQHILVDGRKTIAALFMAGDIIDMRNSSRLDRGQLIALSKSDICQLSTVQFDTIMGENQNARHLVWNNIRDQTFRAIDHSADLAKKKALEKLASFIFECKRRQEFLDADSTIAMPLRRCDLSEYLGMQPETVSRCFKTLEDRGLLAHENLSKIKVLDLPALRRIANGEAMPIAPKAQLPPALKVLSFG